MADPAPRHRAPRSANWTTPELEMLFRACKDNPVIALGFNGSDSRSRQKRHAFYADIAERVSALGIGTRDGHAAQRKLVDALKDARMTAKRLLTDGTSLDEALAEAMKQVPHVDLLGPVLRIAVTATASSRDTLTSPASVEETSTGSASDLQPSTEVSASEHATASQSAASTSAPSASGAYPQDFPIAEALDELSILSTSTEGGTDIWDVSQAVPLQQIPVEREEGGSSGVVAPPPPPPAAPAPPPPPPPPAPAHELPEACHGGGGDGGGDPTDADDDAGERGDNGDEDDAVPLRPRARGPHGRRPLPTHISGLWAQISQDYIDSRNAFQENMDQLRESLVLESTSLQAAVRGQFDDVVDHLSGIRGSINTMERSLSLLTDRVLRELDQRGGGVGRGRGRGRGRGETVTQVLPPTRPAQRPATPVAGGSEGAAAAPAAAAGSAVPAVIRTRSQSRAPTGPHAESVTQVLPPTQPAQRPATPVAGGSEGAAAAAAAAAGSAVPPGRARSKIRAPTGSRAISSPSLPTKRARK